MGRVQVIGAETSSKGPTGGRARVGHHDIGDFIGQNRFDRFDLRLKIFNI